jgi:hypothetical protein
MELTELQEKIKKLDAGEIAAPQGMILRRFSGIEVTVGQLKAAVKANPEHPVAVNLTPMLKGYADPRHNPHKVTVSKIDMEALLDNKEVKTEVLGESLVDNSRMTEVRKVLGDTITKQPEPKSPASPEKFDKVK